VRLLLSLGGDHMKKKILFLAAMLLIAAVIVIGIYSAPIIANGYSMYKNAISEKSIEEAINKIRNDDSYLKFEDVPEGFVDEVLKSEDKRFYSHVGIDFIATARAMYQSIKERSYAEGGSTITQQVAKNIYFSFDKKLERKVAEVFVAADLEKTLTKNEILELYLNIVYFGEGCYGLEEAANHYYGATPASLSSIQISALVFTLKRPNDYNPNVYKH
jgi:membrane peptidoglycan carboxypeptidase